MRWQENVEQTLTEKKIASIASLSQLVQHEKKNHSQLVQSYILSDLEPDNPHLKRFYNKQA
jgi:hypothetical protein